MFSLARQTPAKKPHSATWSGGLEVSIRTISTASSRTPFKIFIFILRCRTDFNLFHKKIYGNQLLNIANSTHSTRP
jgi:hypothetical protein